MRRAADFRHTNLDAARAPLLIESVAGPTFLCNRRGVNIARAGAAFATMESTVSLPRLRWLERDTPQGQHA